MGKIYWSPKTKASARKIPIVFDEFKDAVLLFFKDNEGLSISRQAVWQVVRKVGKEAFGAGRVLYPHAIRATCSNLWSNTGIDPYSLTSVMGWSDMRSAQPYLKAREEKKVLADLQKHKAEFMN